MHKRATVHYNHQYIRLVLLLLRFEHKFSVIFPASVVLSAFPTLWLKPLRLRGAVTLQNVTIDAKCNINANCNNF